MKTLNQIMHKLNNMFTELVEEYGEKLAELHDQVESEEQEEVLESLQTVIYELKEHSEEFDFLLNGEQSSDG